MITEALKHWMAVRKTNPKRWSLAAGLGETTVRDIIERGRDPRYGTLEKLAEAMEISMGELLLISESRPLVPVVGYVGAGAEVFPFDDHAKGGGMDEVPAPPGLEDAVAVYVRSDSMWPVYRDGDLLFYRRAGMGRAVPSAAIGEECIVKVKDGPMLIKVLKAGNGKLWTLESYNAPPRMEQNLEWASPVLFADKRGRFKRAA